MVGLGLGKSGVGSLGEGVLGVGVWEVVLEGLVWVFLEEGWVVLLYVLGLVILGLLFSKWESKPSGNDSGLWKMG